jgi:CRP-like cAMP-binding protein
MPKFVPATVTELSRVPLLSGLAGEQLTEIARRMDREEVPPGRQVVREGEPGERFYVVLSGLFSVSQEELGPRRVLRPGDYFGEVALAMSIPRTASVRALTPAVVASCDRETFDQLLRPLFADDQPTA